MAYTFVGYVCTDGAGKKQLAANGAYGTPSA